MLPHGLCITPPKIGCCIASAQNKCGNGGSPVAIPAQPWSGWSLHNQSGHAAEATNPDPHVRGVERDPTRLFGGGSRSPLWYRHRGGTCSRLSLTEIATGWTECLTLMHRSREAVLAALKRVRTLFPFPILGIDADNVGEYINVTVLAYSEQEHITFTRGRPYRKLSEKG